MDLIMAVSYSGVLGGGERVLLDFMRGLNGELLLACPEGELAAAARRSAITVLALASRPQTLRGSLPDRMLAGGRLVAHGLEVRRLVRDLDPDLLVLSGMRSALALPLLAARHQARTIIDHHDLLPGPLIARAVRAAARRAALVVVPSRAAAEDLALGERVVVIHPGVDVATFPSAPAAAEAATVLLLGAIVPWKEPELALEACALARRQLPELRLRIAGAPLDPAGRALLDRLAARADQPDLSGAVDLVGAVDDVAGELARASCLLHCAAREAFGLGIVEALAAGRPVAAPAGGGPLEILDASCGILYPPGDARAAAGAVVELLSDPQRAREMGQRGRARVERCFTSTAMQERFASAAAMTMGGRPRGSQPGIDPAELALVTVTHNSAAELEALLDSAQRHLPGARVVVIDCASQDTSLAVAESFANAAPVPLEQNIGFGRACNLGLALVREPVSVLVNPDVELLDDSLLALAAQARRERRLLAPLVLSGDGSRQDSVHPRPASPAELLRAVVPYTALPLSALAPWRARGARRVGWAVGCALVAQTELLRSLGPFDEGIFLYGEDLELGLRAAAAGIETWFCPQARVLHHGGHSTSVAFGGEAFERLARTRWAAVGRTLGPGPQRRDHVAQTVTFASRIAAKRLLGKSAARERRQLAALRRAR